jgi:16S rRNA (guanine527-N7)-methyltransferase
MKEFLSEEILTFLSKCNIENLPSFCEKCLILKKILLEENEKYNLTAISADDEFWVKHICDCASISIFYGQYMANTAKICDIGSGAGFPASVIALAFPDIEVSAVESSQKKSEFIKYSASKLGLKNLRVFPARAENLNKESEFKNAYAIITARAVSRANIILKQSSAMLAPSGRYILYKTPSSADAELNELNKISKHEKILWEKSAEFALPMNMGMRIFLTGKSSPRQT